MKFSKYNNIVRTGAISLLYNALNDTFLALSSDVDLMLRDIVSVKARSKLYDVLLQGGFIVDDSVDELSIVENHILSERFDKSKYEIVVNTTMDCNVRCWYCYESHIKDSVMSDDISQRIIRHIESKLLYDSFKLLSLSFFGGEPMLNISSVLLIVEAAKELSEKYGFELNIGFTTNLICLDPRLIDALKGVRSSFQIPFDGNRTIHNSVKRMKSDLGSSFDRTIANMKLLSDNLPDYEILVRINYGKNTFCDYQDFLSQFSFLDKSKVSFALVKIWQVDDSEIDKVQVHNFVEYVSDNGYNINYYDLAPCSSCYADKINQVVINFDGKIFKCSACDFSNEIPDGVLQEDGSILWNFNRITKRMGFPLPKICRECSLLPACSRICSKKLFDNPDSNECVLDKDYIENAIVYNFKNRIKKN